MKENTKTWLTAVTSAALLSLAALIYHLYPGIVAKTGLAGDDLGGIAVTTLVLWLALRKKQAITQQARIVLGIVVAVGLLVGLAFFFIS